MNITVKNRKTYHGPGEWICRGRSPLGNPFHLNDVNDDAARDKVIQQYRMWLWEKLIAHDKDVCDELDRLFEIVSSGKQLILICFCAPKPCHGDIIVSYLKQRIMTGDNLFGGQQ